MGRLPALALSVPAHQAPLRSRTAQPPAGMPGGLNRCGPWNRPGQWSRFASLHTRAESLAAAIEHLRAKVLVEQLEVTSRFRLHEVFELKRRHRDDFRTVSDVLLTELGLREALVD